jgi:hypothetical protein
VGYTHGGYPGFYGHSGYSIRRAEPVHKDPYEPITFESILRKSLAGLICDDEQKPKPIKVHHPVRY